MYSGRTVAARWAQVAPVPGAKTLTPTETTGTATSAATSIAMSAGARRSMAVSVRSPSRDPRDLEPAPAGIGAQSVPVLQLSGVAHRFGAKETFAGLELSLAGGEICCLLGPSGCGKTTALRCIGGFEPVTAGRIAIDGAIVSAAGRTHLPPERRRIGMVFQDFALVPAPHGRAQRRLRHRRPRRRGPARGRAARRRRPGLGGRPDAARAVGRPAAARRAGARARAGAARCCCSTSPSPTSTPACARRSPPTSAPSSSRPGRPPSS